MSHTGEDTYRFNSGYRESISLKDGTELNLRLVIPADKLLLVDGMDNFSPESRYRRFLAAKQALSEAELQYLTELDGVYHFAIGALLGSERGVGVARFVRLPESPETAEPAIAVLDTYQNKGLGKVLFARLMEAARERGIRRFHGVLLLRNKPMKHLLQSFGQKTSFKYKAGLLEFEMPLDGHDDRE